MCIPAFTLNLYFCSFIVFQSLVAATFILKQGCFEWDIMKAEVEMYKWFLTIRGKPQVKARN